MSRIGVNFPRSTLLGASDTLLSHLQRSQSDFQRTQAEISSGRKVNRPSDESARTSVILMLENQLQSRDQHERNLRLGVSVLNFADQSLTDVTDTMIEAQTIASSQIGIGSNAATRASESTIIDGMIKGLVDVANRQIQGVSLFGGSREHRDGGPMFEPFMGGIRYRGSSVNLTNDQGFNDPLGVNSNGNDAFSALSNRIRGTIDLDPQATATTRLVDIHGSQGAGVHSGSLLVAVNGNRVIVDLATADTLGDIVTRVNDAIGQVDSSAGALSIAGPGFSLQANVGHTISIDELGAGETAADLGLVISATGTTVAGGDVDPRLTVLSDLSTLGRAVDWISGMKIVQGGVTAVTDFSTASTVQDLQNEIDRLDMGLRLEINDTGRGLNLVSEVSGIALSVGESANGSTAHDLGLRTFGIGTALADFRFGIGVEVQKGKDDFAVHLHDGRAFNVNLDGAVTVRDALVAMIDAATAAGLTVGAPGVFNPDINLGLATDGNGLQLHDNTVGPMNFHVEQLGQSLAATHLGIYQDAGAHKSINGEDVAQVRAENIFTHLINLRDSLFMDDSSGITFAGDAIRDDIEDLTKVRADVGVRTRQFEQQQARSDELKTTELTMLSDIRDTDLATAITEFLQLEQQLQASLQVGAQRLQLSFLDFLR